MGDAHEGEAEGGAGFGGDGGVEFGENAVEGASGGAEDPVNAFAGDGFGGVVEGVTSDFFGGYVGWFGFTVGAGRVDAFGKGLDGGGDQAADGAGEQALEEDGGVFGLVGWGCLIVAHGEVGCG